MDWFPQESWIHNQQILWAKEEIDGMQRYDRPEQLLPNLQEDIRKLDSIQSVIESS